MVEKDQDYLRELIQEWGNRQKPPANAKSQLLAIASGLTVEKSIRHVNNLYFPKPFLYTNSKMLEPFNQPHVWLVRMSMTPLRYLA